MLGAFAACGTSSSSQPRGPTATLSSPAAVTLADACQTLKRKKLGSIAPTAAQFAALESAVAQLDRAGDTAARQLAAAVESAVQAAGKGNPAADFDAVTAVRAAILRFC